MAQARASGRLIQWDDSKGYGFIVPDDGGAKLFVHIKSFGLRARRPFVGERLSYVAGSDGQGKPRAQQVLSLEPKAAVAAPRKASAPQSRVWLIPAFATLVLACQLLWGLPHALWGVYVAMSMATFIVYYGDKRAAAKGAWRVAESTLHGLALACGWPGALLAQSILRHKSSKPRFQRLFWFSAASNVLGFVLIFTPLGTLLLRFLLPS
jgi:uncharacterized membrane protein YsdA (DUF1294 family)/cold shock CspA family protein